MNCRGCGRDIEADSAFCRFCGSQASFAPMGARRLTRRVAEGRIAGVCAGIAGYLDVDVTLVRLIWVILTIVPGMLIGGVLAYLIAWLLIPRTDAPPLPDAGARRLRRSDSDRVIAGVCGGLAEYFRIDSTAVRLLWVVLSIWPGVILGGIVVYLLAWLVMPRGSRLQVQAAHA